MRHTTNTKSSLTKAFVLFLLLFTGITPTDLHAKSRFLIPWGNGDSEVGLAEKSQRIKLPFPGPSSVRVFSGRVYLLDTINSSLKVYSKEGKLLKAKRLPHSVDGKATVYPDFFVTASGTIYVLESTAETVHILNKKLSSVKSVPVPKESALRSLSAISVIKDEIIVFDCFSGNLIFFSPESKVSRKVKGMYYGDLIHNGENLIYGARIKGGMKPEPGRISVFSLNLSSTKRKLAAVFSGKSEINSYSLAGVDSAGRVYLTLAFGGADETTAQWLLIFNNTGALHRKVRLPITSGHLTMTRTKDVGADGTLAVVKPTEKGLVVSVITVP